MSVGVRSGGGEGGMEVRACGMANPNACEERQSRPVGVVFGGGFGYCSTEQSMPLVRQLKQQAVISLSLSN